MESQIENALWELIIQQQNDYIEFRFIFHDLLKIGNNVHLYQ